MAKKKIIGKTVLTTEQFEEISAMYKEFEIPHSKFELARFKIKTSPKGKINIIIWESLKMNIIAKADAIADFVKKTGIEVKRKNQIITMAGNKVVTNFANGSDKLYDQILQIINKNTKSLAELNFKLKDVRLQYLTYDQLSILQTTLSNNLIQLEKLKSDINLSLDIVATEMLDKLNKDKIFEGTVCISYIGKPDKHGDDNFKLIFVHGLSPNGNIKIIIDRELIPQDVRSFTSLKEALAGKTVKIQATLNRRGVWYTAAKVDWDCLDSKPTKNSDEAKGDIDNGKEN